MIYCVEDDRNILQMMLYTFKSAGISAKGFENGQDFWEEVKTRKPDLVMLDIMLPGEDGLEILRKLRADEETKDIYIIMATAKGSEYDTVVGLDSGADYYLTKPFGMLEMIAHVKAVMRRGKKIIDTRIITAGKVKMNVTNHTVTVEGKEISLTYKEYEILKLLMENQGKAFSRDAILEQVWGYDYTGETRTVDVHIAALRTKLDYCADYIETIRGIGYIMEVRE